VLRLERLAAAENIHAGVCVRDKYLIARNDFAERTHTNLAAFEEEKDIWVASMVHHGADEIETDAEGDFAVGRADMEAIGEELGGYSQLRASPTAHRAPVSYNTV
jgi:hypothetical protein